MTTVVDNGRMAKPKKNDRHKSNRMVRITEDFAVILQEIADANRTNLTIEVNRVLREELARLGMWPPPIKHR